MKPWLSPLLSATSINWIHLAFSRLPTDADETYIKSLMKPVYERAKMASWIAPPAKGINALPEDFEYVRL